MKFDIGNYDYNKRKRNLTSEAVGVVKGTKYFPVYSINGKENILKPLSKTKPFLTPLFAYSEVFWSNIIYNYFDDKAPNYSLAYCDNLPEKYYDRGVISESIVQNDENLLNLLEYFRKHPDKNVDIDNYINYCGKYYDYTPILNSDFFKNNHNLGNELAYQILQSILKGDVNYHYENVQFICKDGKIQRMAPPIDHEYSTFFMFPETEDKKICMLNDTFLSSYIDGILSINDKEYLINESDDSFESINISKNVNYITENFPDVTEKFLSGIRKLKQDIDKNKINLNINFDSNFIGKLNSSKYTIGYTKKNKKNDDVVNILEDYFYKNKPIPDEKKDLVKRISGCNFLKKDSLVDSMDLSKKISKDIYSSIRLFSRILEMNLNIKKANDFER